jgi:hypothetical protein
MSPYRRNASSTVLDQLSQLEGLALFGGLGLLAYWIMTGGAKAFLCPAGGGICSLFPKQTTMLGPLPAPGTGQAAFPSQANSVAPHTVIVTQANAGGVGPVTYGPSYEVPGTGLTVADFQASGYSDSELGTLLTNLTSYTDDGNPDGGASGSW